MLTLKKPFNNNLESAQEQSRDRYYFNLFSILPLLEPEYEEIKSLYEK